jgi:hypothetical protein
MPPDFETADWIARCAARLRREWPNLATQDIEEAAEALLADARWRELPPEQAAVAWLRLGALAS